MSKAIYSGYRKLSVGDAGTFQITPLIYIVKYRGIFESNHMYTLTFVCMYTYTNNAISS